MQPATFHFLLSFTVLYIAFSSVPFRLYVNFRYIPLCQVRPNNIDNAVALLALPLLFFRSDTTFVLSHPMSWCQSHNSGRLANSKCISSVFLLAGSNEPISSNVKPPFTLGSAIIPTFILVFHEYRSHLNATAERVMDLSPWLDGIQNKPNPTSYLTHSRHVPILF